MAAPQVAGIFSGARGQNDLTVKGGHHPLVDFFGPFRGSDEMIRADDKLSMEAYDMPVAYRGKNKRLESVLDFLIHEEDEFYTKLLLPWEFTEDINIVFDVFKFDRTLADVMPHQGVPRLVTASMSTHTDALIRRGLAFMIESDFYKTQRGKEHFMLNLQQIADSVHTTCYFGVIHALLTAENYYKDYRYRFGTLHGENDIMHHERWQWGIVQKQQRGMYILDAHIKHDMKRQGVTPDLWVLPPKMSLYMSMVPDSEVVYEQKGPKAAGNLETNRTQLPSFRGCRVVESNSFDVDFTGQPINLLRRDRQCGSFFYMPPGGDTADAIAFYDAYTDNWATFTRADLKKMALKKDGQQDTDGYLIFRPHQTWAMNSAILAKGGRELGSTFHGHHDMVLQSDAVRKIYMGNYSFYSKSVVKRPKNFALVEDVFCSGYVAGEGTVHYTATIYEQDVASDDIGTPRQRGSIIVWPIKETEVTGDDAWSCPEVLDLTGYFSSHDRHNLAKNTSGAQYPRAKDLYDELKLSNIEPVRALDDFLRPVKEIYTVMFRGHQYFKPKDGDWTITSINKGHWGKNVYPGCKQARTGFGDFLKEMDYQSTVLPKTGKNPIETGRGVASDDTRGMSFRPMQSEMKAANVDMRAADLAKKSKRRAK